MKKKTWLERVRVRRIGEGEGKKGLYIGGERGKGGN